MEFEPNSAAVLFSRDEMEDLLVIAGQAERLKLVYKAQLGRLELFSDQTHSLLNFTTYCVQPDKADIDENTSKYMPDGATYNMGAVTAIALFALMRPSLTIDDYDIYVGDNDLKPKIAIEFTETEKEKRYNLGVFYVETGNEFLAQHPNLGDLTEKIADALEITVSRNLLKAGFGYGLKLAFGAWAHKMYSEDVDALRRALADDNLVATAIEALRQTVAGKDDENK